MPLGAEGTLQARSSFSRTQCCLPLPHPPRAAHLQTPSAGRTAPRSRCPNAELALPRGRLPTPGFPPLRGTRKGRQGMVGLTARSSGKLWCFRMVEAGSRGGGEWSRRLVGRPPSPNHSLTRASRPLAQGPLRLRVSPASTAGEVPPAELVSESHHPSRARQTGQVHEQRS